jgi:hypothetical protein
MDPVRRQKLYLIPVLFLMLAAVAGLVLEFYSRHFRGIGTPFLYPSLGFILLSLYFTVRRRWLYFVLLGITPVFLFFFFKDGLWLDNYPASVVYYYHRWSLNTQTGLLRLHQPMGPHPPTSGAYVSCNFSFKNWLDFLKTQPTLCTGFDDQLRLQMTLNDGEGSSGPVREFQLNYFSVDRKSLLGEPLDRSALRIAFLPKEKGLQPKYKIHEIYQVFERELEPGKNKIVESFSWNATGGLVSFTESPTLKFTGKDVYALYGPDGDLMEIPNRGNRSYSFPAKIDIQHYEVYHLPGILSPDGNSS